MLHHFKVWDRQLGASGRELLRKLSPAGVEWHAFRKRPWSRYREAMVLAESIGLVRRTGGRVLPGPRLFLEWSDDRAADEHVWDIAISYASEDIAVAQEIFTQLRDESRVFYAPAEKAPLRGTDLNIVLPNVYGVQSEYVLVLSTTHYVTKYWTRKEWEAVVQNAPDRILLLDMGDLPSDRPEWCTARKPALS